MPSWEETAVRLDCDRDDYRAMLQIGLAQQQYIAQEDLSGLERSFAQMRQIMNEMRLRREHTPDWDHPELERRRAELRHLIGKLQEVRQANEVAVRRLMERTCDEMKQVQQGRRARQIYHNATHQEARFFDGVK